MSGLDQAGADQSLECLKPSYFLAEQDRLFALLTDATERLRYVHERCGDRVLHKTTRDASLFYRAGVLIGSTGSSARDLMKMVNRKGVEGTLTFLAESAWISRIADARPSVSQIGFVYTARFTRYPHVIKIGFSTSPVRRIKELEYTFGEGIELLGAYIGTMLDEARDHVASKHRYIGRECMFAPDFEDVRPGRIPPFLLGPFRHLAED